MTLHLSSRAAETFRVILACASTTDAGKDSCAFALRMFASGGYAVLQRVVWDGRVWVTIDHGSPLSAHASTFGRCAAGGTHVALRACLDNSWSVAYLGAVALPEADPRCCGRHCCVVAELRGAPMESAVYRSVSAAREDKRRVLLPYSSTIGECACAFALPLIAAAAAFY